MFLLDNNLSPKIARRIEHLFARCLHVESVGLDTSDDPEVWDFASQNNLLILTKDAWHTAEPCASRGLDELLMLSAYH
jgi:predicted nuclease of predicted toxin-antitoxin system